MNQEDPIVVAGAARTPMGGFQGDLSRISKHLSWDRSPIRAALERAGVGWRVEVDEVLMGCVLPAGLGQAPARQASLRRRPARRLSAAPPSTRSAGPA